MTFKNKSFMPGVRGVELVEDKEKVSHVQKKVQKMCDWQTTGFPGLQPVSMDLVNLKKLHEKPYRVSWKADGMRLIIIVLTSYKRLIHFYFVFVVFYHS